MDNGLSGSQPSGTISISANGTYDVAKYKQASVAVTPKSQTVTGSKYLGSSTNGTITLTFDQLTTVYGITKITRSGSWTTSFQVIATDGNGNASNGITISGNTVSIYVRNNVSDAGQTGTISVTAAGI